jgi:hypothetical protein
MALHRQIRSIGDYRIRLGPSKLYLDDIQDILSTVETFAKEHSPRPDDKGKDWTIALAAGKAIADSVEDLRDATQDELKRVLILLNKPSVQISLSRYVAFIETDNDDLESRALADDLAAFINSKKARLRALLPAFILPSGFFVLVVVGIIEGAYHSAHHKSAAQYYAGAIASAIFAVAFFIFSYKTSANNNVWIIAARRNESKRLSARTRRDIMIGTIGAVIAAVIGAIVSAILVK